MDSDHIVVFKLKRPLFGWATGEVLTYDPNWGEWTRKKTGEVFGTRSDIRTGEVVLLLNFVAFHGQLTSILEPVKERI